MDRIDDVIRCIRRQEPELRRRGIQHLAVFGSAARGEDRPDSDNDIAVDIAPGNSFSLIRLEETRLLLEDAIGRRVDLGETDQFRPHVKMAFEHDRIQVF
jgi:predicted nucleotidyltransferase